MRERYVFQFYVRTIFDFRVHPRQCLRRAYLSRFQKSVERCIDDDDNVDSTHLHIMNITANSLRRTYDHTYHIFGEYTRSLFLDLSLDSLRRFSRNLLVGIMARLATRRRKIAGFGGSPSRVSCSMKAGFRIRSTAT